MEEDYYIQKLLKMPVRFKELYSQKQYAMAKYQYDTAIRIADFMEAPQKVRDRLFGNRQNPDKPTDGMFPEEFVQKCYLECAVKRNMGEENLACRRSKSKVSGNTAHSVSESDYADFYFS